MSIPSRPSHTLRHRLEHLVTVPAALVHRLVTVPASALLLTGAIVGCGGDGGDGLPDPPASPQPQVDDQPAALDLTPEEQEAVEESQAAFDEFMTAYQDILTAGEPPTDPVLDRIYTYGGGPLVRAAHGEIFDNYQAGRRADGQIDWQVVEVVKVDMHRMGTMGGAEREIPSTWQRYCIDATDWTTVDKETGQPAYEPDNQHLISQPGGRYLVTVEAEFFDSTPVPVPEEELDPVWEAVGWDEADQPC